MEQLGMYEAILTDVFEKKNLFKKESPNGIPFKEVDKTLTRLGRYVGGTGNVNCMQISPKTTVKAPSMSFYPDFISILS